VRPDMSVIKQHLIPPDVARRVCKSLEAHHLDVWVYDDHAWYVHERHGPHVDREEWTVRFPPTVVADFGDALDRAVKIVGVSDDFPAVARGEADLQQEFGKDVSASRSQPYYLDVTHPLANKGTVIETISRVLKIPTSEIATIGDGPNDVLMFEKSGASIAMGHASKEIQQAATYVTTSSEDEGFANAVERFLLGNH
jgi:Cof subfamily protein (haloacid dehalogenase superfamily)